MRQLIIILLFLYVATTAIAQNTLLDSARGKESFAVAELGGAAGFSINNRSYNFGPSVAIEISPIENWLELELGISPAFGANSNQLAADFLIKKPWTLSPKAEFMFGAGPVWTHSNDQGVITNDVGGELALDFM